MHSYNINLVEEDEEEEEEFEEESDELIPDRPELKYQKIQKLKFLCPPSNLSPHPRTLFFYYNPKLNKNQNTSELKIIDYEIKEKKYMVVYKAYQNIPLCLSEPMKFNNIIRTKIFDNTNIIWKLLKQNLMFPLLKTLNKYQKYNHFPITWQLSRKDNLYNNYQKMKTNFPNEYNYMPETYIIPKDKDIFLSKNENYQLNQNNIWLIKPVASSRGRGIRILTDIKDIPEKCLITHYISNPHLINGKKYDLRLYVLITGYTPLKIYLFNDGLARFCSEDFDLDQNKLTDNFIHLTNYSINKDSKKFEKNNCPEKEEGNKWSLLTYKKHLIEEKIDLEKIWNKIKDIIIKTIISITDNGIPIIKCFKLSSVNLFEIYGFDILLDDNLNPWLMEVNLNPSLNCDSYLDLKIKSQLLTDIFNIIGPIPFSHDGKFNIIDEEVFYTDSVNEAVNETLHEFHRPTGGFERIFPLKENINIYSKFLFKPEEENKAVWANLQL